MGTFLIVSALLAALTLVYGFFIVRSKRATQENGNEPTK